MYNSCMGVVRPPWIDKEWFDKCPYNYCDHFGDEEFLATICKICRDTRNEKMPEIDNNWEPQQTEQSRFRLEKGTVSEHIDVLEGDDDFTAAVNKLLSFLARYSNNTQKIINVLWCIPDSQKTELIKKALDVLSHSRHYASVKIRRGYASFLEEQESSISEEISDSKTSAFFAYIAVERNSRVFLALAREGVISPLEDNYFDLADISLNLMDFIQKVFFPREKIKYNDVGCEEYDQCFAGKQRKLENRRSSS